MSFALYRHIKKVQLVSKHPTKLGTLASRVSEKEIVVTITDKFKNYPSIISIKNEF